MLSWKSSATRKVNDLIKRYIDYLRDERNLSAHTLRNYLSDLNQFEQFLRGRDLCLDKNGNIDEQRLDIHIARAYLASINKQVYDTVEKAVEQNVATVKKTAAKAKRAK